MCLTFFLILLLANVHKREIKKKKREKASHSTHLAPSGNVFRDHLDGHDGSILENASHDNQLTLSDRVKKENVGYLGLLGLVIRLHRIMDVYIYIELTFNEIMVNI